MNDWDYVHWFKATDSGDHGCVEIAYKGDHVGVRDTKDRSKPMHVFTRHEWECVLAGAKRGEFDLPQ